MSEPLSSHLAVASSLPSGRRKAVIMQPYFLPYLGYFQLLAAADLIVIYDDVQYTKSSWINRNRFYLNGRIEYLSIDLQRDSHQKKINERTIADEYFKYSVSRYLKSIESNYRDACFYNDVMSLMTAILQQKERRLSVFLLHSIREIMDLLALKSNVMLASDLNIDPSLKSQQRVIEICKMIGADTYINPISGMGLYDDLDFSNAGIDLWFLRPEMPKHPPLKQSFEHPSIIDLFMHNAPEQIRAALTIATLHKKISNGDIAHA